MSTDSPATKRVEVFYTSILSNPKIRSNSEKVDRFLAQVPHTRYDISHDETAKAVWKRKNGGDTELPMILVDGARPGGIEALEEAVEFGELRQFLRLDSAPAPGLHDDDKALADLSPEEAAKLVAEIEASETKKVPLQPTSDGVETKAESQGAPEALVKDPGMAEAEEFETGMA